MRRRACVELADRGIGPPIGRKTGLARCPRDSPATLSRVENGHMPDLETFAKICRWLERDPSEFLGFARPVTERPAGVVHFRKKKTVSRDTAVALGELILAAQKAIEAREGLAE